jgi:hypothetical protein
MTGACCPLNSAPQVAPMSGKVDHNIRLVPWTQLMEKTK